MHERARQPAAVVAFAGRRVDASGAPPRFPLMNVALVRERIATLLVAECAAVLVASAACGADLVALEQAERLGLRRRIILPTAPERFRETSVVDRPGDWGPAFDRLVDSARAAGDLVLLDAGEGEVGYAAATGAIIREAQALGRGDAHRLLAVVAWEGVPRNGADATGAFQRLSAKAGFEQRSVRTLAG